MKLLIIPLSVLLVCAFVITGCSSSTTPTPGTTPSVTPVASAPAAGNPVPTAPLAASTTTVKTTAVTSAATPPPSTGSPASNSSKYGGVVRYVQASGPGTPLAPWESLSAQTTFLVMEPLLREDFGGKLVGIIAETWDVNSADPTPNVVFHIRKGLKFSDSTDCDAQAVAWSLQKQKDSGLQAGTTSYWKSIDLVDNGTVRVNFTMWRNTFLRSFSEIVAMVTSPAAFQKNGLDWMRGNMVGTGPFLQTTYQKDVVFKSVKNPGYWQTGYPYLDEVDLLYVTDMMTRDALMKFGGAEMMDIQPIEAAQFSSSDYKISSESAGSAILIPDSANADSPWFNLKVRQAAEYAIDKEAIVKAFGYGYMKAAYQYSTPAQIGWDANFSGSRVYDLNQAKKLLADAGYADGFKTTITCNPTFNKDIAVSIQAYLSKVGIQAALQFPESAQWTSVQTSTWKNGLLLDVSLGAANNNTGLNTNFGVTPTFYKSMGKPDGWKDAFTASLGAPVPDPALIQKCVKMLYDNAGPITLYYSTTLWVQKSNVQDSGAGARGNVQYWNPPFCWLSK